MVKIAIIFYLFLYSPLLAHSQTDTTTINNDVERNLTFGINLSYFTTPDLYFNDGFALPTFVSMNNNKYTVLLGPVWWIDKNDEVNAFRGGMLSCRYFPLKLRKRINFHFLYNLVYQYEKKEWSAQMHFYPQLPVNHFYSATLTTKWHSLINQFGYGFIINIYKSVYLNQSFSIGIEYYNYQSNTNVREDSSLSSDYSSVGNGTSSFLTIGLGYNFE